MIVVASLAASYSRRGERNDHGRGVGYQVDGHRRQSVETTIGRAIFDCNVAAFDVARVFETFSNSTDQSIIELESAEQADQRHGRLLRARGQRPGSRSPAEECDELAPLHVPPERTTPYAIAKPNSLRPGGE